MVPRCLGIFAVVLLFVSAAGCAGTSTPTAPDPTPSCETNHTATVKFENRSVSTTMDVIWDGSKLVTVAPGQTTDPRTVAAGFHTLQFRVTNSSQGACTLSTPNLAQCSNHHYWCPS